MNRPHSIRTWSGNYLDLAAPKPAEIRPADVYWGLASKFRFAGQTRGRLITVAEHSVAVGALCAGLAKGRGCDNHRALQARRAGLLHDAAEAFLGDVPSPGKKLVPGFHEIEAPLVTAVSKLLNPNYVTLDEELLDIVGSADRICMAAEWNLLNPRAEKPESILSAYPALVEAAEEYYKGLEPHQGDVAGAAFYLYDALADAFGEKALGAFEK